MTPDRVHEDTLRPNRLDYRRLLWALAISVAIHLLCYGTYVLGRRFHVWEAMRLPAWLKKTHLLATAPKQPQPAATNQAVPLVFVDVNPEQSTKQPPKHAKFYSDKNSQAANRDADQDTGAPKISGKQTEVAKAENVKRSPFDKLQPVFPKATRNRPQKQAKPKSSKPKGDLVMAKPETRERQGTGKAEESRPRTIQQALKRLHRNQLIGQKMKQKGGVNRFRLQASFDAKATPFGAYDAAFIEAVQSRWYDLLDNISYDGYRRGKVEVEFHLNYDGRITDMKVLKNSVGEMLGLLCEKAVLDPAPYDKWPREMRLMVDKNYRDIHFTFYYN